MLGLGWSEMLVLAVVALIVVGPKDLPMLLRNLGRMMGSVRRMSNEFRKEIDKAIAMDEVKEAKKALSDPLKQTHAEISREFNTMRDGKAVPSGRIKPSDPDKESVAETLRERAGLEPKAVSAAGTTVVAGASGAATPSKAEDAPGLAADRQVAKAKTRAPAPRAKAPRAKPAAAKSEKGASSTSAGASKTSPARSRSKAPSDKTPSDKATAAKTATAKTAKAKTARAKAPEAEGASNPAPARKRAAPKKSARIAENQGGER